MKWLKLQKQFEKQIIPALKITVLEFLEYRQGIHDYSDLFLSRRMADGQFPLFSRRGTARALFSADVIISSGMVH